MAISTATIKYLIGINSDISSNVFYLDEQTILYPCGCYCVFFNTEQKTMRLLLASEKGAEITAMAISPNRNYTAVGLKYEKPSINILDLFALRKKKTLVCPELFSCKILSLSFSSDSRCIIAICDDPSRTLLYWSWEKSRLLITAKVTTSLVPETLNFISFNPQDHLNVYAFGNGLLKSFRFVEGNFKQFNFPKIEPRDFKCYCWDANERLLVGTGNGRVLFIEGTDLRLDFNVFQYLNLPNDVARTHGVTAIVSYSKGFITACGTQYVQFFERVEDKDNYKFVRDVLLPSDTLENNKLCDQIIKWMVVNPSEDVLVISTNMKQMYSTQVNPPETKYMKQTSVFDVLVQPFHYKSVTGCCVCSWKPFIATSSLDGSIKVWNYETFTLELSKDFSEEVYSISMHPMGLFLLAGFSDKLRFMYILRDDFKQFKEFNIRMCTHCNFSRGGHMFAAVNNNFIQVYSSITFEMLANLKGHNGKVQATAWCMDDNNLISCGLDGAVYDWELKTGKRIGQCVLKSCAYNDVIINFENKNFYAVGSDYSMKEIHESDILRTFPSGDVLFKSIALSWSNTMLFVGTNNGYIRSLEYPIMLPGRWLDYPCHSLETTHMTFTTDDRYLISTSKDASIAIWKVNVAESRTLKRDRSTIWSEEILIPRFDLEEKNGWLAELKSRVEELNMENEYQMHLKDMSYNDKIREMTETFIQEMENLKTKNQALQNDKSKQESRHDEIMTEIMEKHCRELQFIESANDKKLLEEYEKFKDLHNRLLKLQEEHDQQVQELEEKQELLQDQLTAHYEGKLQEVEKKLEQRQEDIMLQQKEYEEMKKQIEEDADMEIVFTKTDYEQQLYHERYSNSKIKDENSILKKKLLAFPKELKESKEECKKYKLEIKRLNIIIGNLEKDIQSLKKELQNQDHGLQDEEKRFYDLKLKNHEIEKLKCELEYNKIIELRQQIEQRETEISNMKEQIKAMQSELENFTQQFIIMDHTTAETKQKLAATSLELSKERMALHRKTALLDRFCADLIDCTSFIQDPMRLKSSIKALYTKYIERNVDKIVTTDPNIQVEWGRQRNHFEYSIHKLKHQLNRTVKNASLENEVLVNKCNKMGEVLQLEREKNRRLLSIMERAK
ncbi:cilia- and flagella-associated protein 57-like [Octopus bimaculoides]|uniref:Cilia- and flagella-associated protein 57 n=1 Tax=Octopus bimaculoides TaxID=37653 RepID=A0A0L8G8T6_OCTBM|nr:cilia- and flagella-associated protein 57-like [Octopus bimaculoides]